MNHLGDTNKMVDTPRTDARRGFHGWYTAVDAEFSEQLERELNAANERIKRLEEAYEGEIGEQPELLGSNVMGLLKRELNFAQKRIKRLEEAGISAIHEAIYGREDDALEIWRKAMEAKP